MKRSERKRVWRGGKKRLPFYIISTIALFIFGGVFVGAYIELWYMRDNIDFSETVEATITSLYSYSDTSQIYHHYLQYEYTSPDGTYYSGITDWFYDKEEAMSHIGEKVQIYIDGDGHSVPSIVYSNKPNVWVLIVGILFLGAGLADLFILVIPHKWKNE